MSYVFLVTAVAFEVIGSFFTKKSAGFTNFIPTLLLFCYYLLALSSLNLAVKKLDLSFAYPIWTGATIIGVSLVGILCFQESANIGKAMSIGVIALGIVGLVSSGRS